MYEKNKTKKLTIRLTEQQHEAVETLSEVYDISPSEFVRQMIAVTVNSYEIARHQDVTPLEAVEKAEQKARKEGKLSDKTPTVKNTTAKKVSDKKTAKRGTKVVHA